MRPRWKAEIQLYSMVLSGVHGACIAAVQSAVHFRCFLAKPFWPSFFAPPEPTTMLSTLVCLEYRLNCVDQWLKLKPKTFSINWYAAIVIRGGIR